MSALSELLRTTFGEQARPDVSLAPYTTFRVGGPADWLIDISGEEDLRRVVAIAGAHGVPLTILGGGSNVLVADEGVRGIVVRLRGGDIARLDDGRVRAAAGVSINGLVRWTIARGLAGIEAWAGTPGTVGGAVHGNAHFQGRLMSEIIERVTVVGKAGDIATVDASAMEFAYDTSRLHRTGEIVLAADVRVEPGDPAALRAIARQSLAYRKRTQPLESRSAGCIFRNPDPSTDIVPEGIPCSAGALVDRAGLKGATEGGARVSPTHGNFILNEGGASARDIRALIERCRSGVLERFGIELREEIVYLGFPATADLS